MLEEGSEIADHENVAAEPITYSDGTVSVRGAAE